MNGLPTPPSPVIVPCLPSGEIPTDEIKWETLLQLTLDRVQTQQPQ